MDQSSSDRGNDGSAHATRVDGEGAKPTAADSVDESVFAASSLRQAQWPEVASGPLPATARKYQRPAAYWADRWLSVRRP